VEVKLVLRVIIVPVVALLVGLTMVSVLLGRLLLGPAGLLDARHEAVHLRGLNLRGILLGSEIEVVVLLIDLFHVNIVVKVADKLLGQVILVKIFGLGVQNLVLRLEDAGSQGALDVSELSRC